MSCAGAACLVDLQLESFEPQDFDEPVRGLTHIFIQKELQEVPVPHPALGLTLNVSIV